MPSIAFSIGTIAASTSPLSTAASVADIDSYGTCSAVGEIGFALQRLFGEGRARPEEPDALQARSCVDRQMFVIVLSTIEVSPASGPIVTVSIGVARHRLRARAP